jgi:hypothetical protein
VYAKAVVVGDDEANVEKKIWSAFGTARQAGSLAV